MSIIKNYGQLLAIFKLIANNFLIGILISAVTRHISVTSFQKLSTPTGMNTPTFGSTAKCLTLCPRRAYVRFCIACVTMNVKKYQMKRSDMRCLIQRYPVTPESGGSLASRCIRGRECLCPMPSNLAKALQPPALTKSLAAHGRKWLKQAGQTQPLRKNFLAPACKIALQLLLWKTPRERFLWCAQARLKTQLKR